MHEAATDILPIFNQPHSKTMKTDPLDRLISMSRQSPPPDPGDPPPFLHMRVMASMRAAGETSAQREWAVFSLGSLPLAAAIAVACAWQQPPSVSPETTIIPEEDAAGLIASALIDSTIPQP